MSEYTDRPARMSRLHYEVIASLIASSADLFKSNAAHARYAVRSATALAVTNPRFKVEEFMTKSMPAWMVGTRHANVWQRETAKAVDNIAAIHAGLADLGLEAAAVDAVRRTNRRQPLS